MPTTELLDALVKISMEHLAELPPEERKKRVKTFEDAVKEAIRK